MRLTPAVTLGLLSSSTLLLFGWNQADASLGAGATARSLSALLPGWAPAPAAPNNPYTEAPGLGGSDPHNAWLESLEEVDLLSHLQAVREAGLRRWHDEQLRDYLGGIPDARQRAVVEYVCLNTTRGEERQMCHKRGARLAHRMQGYRRLSLHDADTLLTNYTAFNPALRVVVRRGEIIRWHQISRGDSPDVTNYINAFIGKLFEGASRGLLRAGHTFDLVVVMGDAGICSRDSAISPASGIPKYPVVKYSVSKRGCPHHIPLSFIEALQSHPPSAGELPWEELDDEVFFRGFMHTKKARVYASILSALGMVSPRLNASLQMGKGEDAACRRIFGEAQAEGLLEGVAEGADAACRVGAVFSRPTPWGEYLRKRYPLQIDGVGASLKIPHLMKGSGAMLAATHEFEESYFPDLIPFVHYVPVSQHVVHMRRNLTATLRWLDANPDAAQSIAEESTRWALRHKTELTDFREWKMFFELLNDALAVDDGQGGGSGEARGWDGVVGPRLPGLRCSGELADVDASVHMSVPNRRSARGSFDGLTLRNIAARHCGGQGLRDELLDEAVHPNVLQALLRRAEGG